MKKIGLMISSLNSGGAERVVSHLTKILSEVYDVHLILFEDTYLEYDYCGTLHSLNTPAKAGILSKVSLLFQRISRLKALIKEEKLECVISFLDSPNIVNILAKTNGCKHIVSVRNFSSIENKSNLVSKVSNALIKLLYRKADCVVTVSKEIEKDYIDNYGIDPKKIKTIYNPYDFELISDMSKEDLTQEEADFFSQRFVFCNVGRIQHQKGVWHLVRCFATVSRSIPNAKLALIGEDYTDGKLCALIDQYGIKDKVLMTGRVKNPYKYMAHSSVYVLTSLFEGFPNAMVEAMACGLPIIAANCSSGPKEILCDVIPEEKLEASLDGDYGILVPELEHEEDWSISELTCAEQILAKVMTDCYNDKPKLEKYSQKSYERSRIYSYYACKENYVSIIENN